MRTLSFLNALRQTSSSLLTSPIPVESKHEPVEFQMRILNEMTFIYVLKLLGVEDEAKLAEIMSRLRRGSFFYSFTHLAHNLAKSKTDFDFLTSPENILVYKKIVEVSEECGIELLPYVNVLSKITENKQYGLYRENDEVVFFLDEYGRHKDTFEAQEFLHQFKKILKYQTQKIFEQFIVDNIFSKIKSTLKKNDEIANETMLAAYVYGIHYYEGLISNASENILLAHIKFCIAYLFKQNEIMFMPKQRNKFFPKFDSHKQAVEYFFEHNGDVLQSSERFIGLLKDYCPINEIYEFCSYLRKNLYATHPKLFDEKKNSFNKFMAQKIREKADEGNVKLYDKMYKLFPYICVCVRHSTIRTRAGELLCVFTKPNREFLFYATENGNMSHKVPELYTVVEVAVLEKNQKGYVTNWRWTEPKTRI